MTSFTFMSKARKPKQKKVKVEIIESEAGWGQRIDGERTFANRGLATIYVNRYNSYNDKPVTPAWYMYAQIVN